MRSVVVKLHRWDQEQVRVLAAAHGGKVLAFSAPIRTSILDFPSEYDALASLVGLNESPLVDYAALDAPVKLAATYHAASNDTLLDAMWNLKRMSVFAAWRHTKGAPEVMLAFVDTGIWPHADLPWPAAGDGLHWTGYPDPTDNAWDYEGANGYSHGTNCYSLAFALNDNATGISGISPGCRPMMVCANYYQDGGQGISQATCAAAIILAVDAGAKVVSMSFDHYYGAAMPIPPPVGWADAARAVYDALEYAKAHGVLLVGAASNEGVPLSTYPNLWPGTFPGVICTGATQEDDDRGQGWTSGSGPGSNYGPRVDVATPATRILLADPHYPYDGAPTDWSATSYAAPQAAAVAALIWSMNPDLTADEVKAILVSTGYPGRNAGFAEDFPNAVIPNALHGVLKAKATVPANAGQVYPALTFSGAGAATDVVSGAAETTLDGAVHLEVSAYSSDPVVAVGLKVGGRRVYFGPPATLVTTATWDGSTNNGITVEAYTASGSVAETYTDVRVTDLALATVPGFTVSADAPVARSVRLYGMRAAGATITVT